jgi:DMSO/TMAO reductase YedYZ molybdopterin-dependent catalytic subunit
MSAEGISLAELQLAARNHGMPLEALRHEITPLGLHYLLVHYDIPVVDPDRYRLTITGRVRTELTLSLDELKAREAVTAPVTMECAGNGRALLEPRPVSQPWLAEAVGTASWTGVRLQSLLAEAGIEDGAVEVVFTGLDRGVEGGVEQVYERSLTVADAQRDDVMLAYACNGAPLPPQHGFPLRLLVPGWYGMTSVKWLERITVVDEPFTGYQMVTGYRMRADADDDGTPVTRMAPRSLLAPPGIPDFMTRKRFLAPGLGAGDARRAARPRRLGAVRVRLGRRRGRPRAVRPRAGRDGPYPARQPAVERRRVRQQRDPARAGDRAGLSSGGLAQRGRELVGDVGRQPLEPRELREVERVVAHRDHDADRGVLAGDRHHDRQPLERRVPGHERPPGKPFAEHDASACAAAAEPAAGHHHAVAGEPARLAQHDLDPARAHVGARDGRHRGEQVQLVDGESRREDRRLGGARPVKHAVAVARREDGDDTDDSRHYDDSRKEESNPFHAGLKRA